ncbi:MAG: potassium channel family protein, partial [Methanomicrobiales archaeon]|nr:potassium channel family protein [Methanomicrobiales archaeon]
MASVSPLRIYLAVLGLAFLAGVIGSMAIEGLSPLDAVYFVIATLTTVGYGDITPKTAAGKVLAVFIIFAGIGSFAAVFASAIDILLGRSGARERRRKVNMIIGVFFSEFGTGMLATLARLDPEAGAIRRDLLVRESWTGADFRTVRERLRGHGFRVGGESLDLEEMRRFLREKRPFLLALMENPAVFEDDGFTNLLQAVFHLADEL